MFSYHATTTHTKHISLQPALAFNPLQHGSGGPIRDRHGRPIAYMASISVNPSNSHGSGLSHGRLSSVPHNHDDTPAVSQKISPISYGKTLSGEVRGPFTLASAAKAFSSQSCHCRKEAIRRSEMWPYRTQLSNIKSAKRNDHVHY